MSDSINQLHGDAIWYTNIRILYAQKRFLEFWPTRDMSYEERMNAIVRFVLYATVLVYAWNRSPKYLVFGLIVIILMSLSYVWTPKRASRPDEETVVALEDHACQRPTVDNPFGNFLLTDYDNPDRPPACPYDEAKADIQDKFNTNLFRNTSDIYSTMASDRQFYSMPNTSIVNDQEAFMKFCYSGFKNDTCKGNPMRCTGNN
jgi:Family of unknown function (DUF5762)